MLKTSLLKNSSDNIQPHSRKEKGIYTLDKGFGTPVKARLEFEETFFKVALQHYIHYVTWILQIFLIVLWPCLL